MPAGQRTRFHKKNIALLTRARSQAPFKSESAPCRAHTKNKKPTLVAQGGLNHQTRITCDGARGAQRRRERRERSWSAQG